MNIELKVTDAVAGHNMKIGAGFSARHFGEDSFDGLVDPVLMLDHFRMTAPTFGAHRHAGISAVTYVFEDSIGSQMNHDSLGNHGPIRPGHLHWMVAGGGAVHDEQPEGKDVEVHGLQIFVNLPAAKKSMQPYAVQVDAAHMPEFQSPGVRVRVVVGVSNGLTSAATLPQPFTLLDGFLSAQAEFRHTLEPGWDAMVYVVSGRLHLGIGDARRVIESGHAVGIGLFKSAVAAELHFTTGDDEASHFVLLCGPALREPP